MGRKSKLTDKQWDDIEKRLLANESASDLAREYGVTEGAIRYKFSTKIVEIKEVTKQVFEAETRFNELPIATKITVRSLVDQMKIVSENMADSAIHGSMTSRRLARLANKEAAKIDEENPLADIDALKGIAALTEMSNKAAFIPMGLMAHVQKSPETDDSGTLTIVHENSPYG